MKLTPRPPAWLRRVPRPPGGHALLAVPLLAAQPLAADSISTVLNNTTLWIIGILAGLATLTSSWPPPSATGSSPAPRPASSAGTGSKASR